MMAPRLASRMRAPIAAALLALVGAGCPRVRSSPAAQDGPPEIVAWVLPYDDSLESLARNAPWIGVASPAYFRVAVTEGRARLEDWDPAAPFPRARLEELRGRAAFEVIPLVGCVDACGPKISRVLDDDAARAHHVRDLARVVREQRLGGLFIDYEEIDAKPASVSRFVKELAAAIHADGKKLGLVVQEPCGSDPACRRAPFPFALRTLTRVVDWLVVMEYDYAVDGSAPPAPRDWVERGLAKTIAEIDAQDRNKVLCALPLYGRLSASLVTDGDTAVRFGDVRPGFVRDLEVTIGPLTLDRAALSKVATVTAGERSGTLYLEDRDTLSARLSLVSKFGLGGVALWRLGGEDPCTARELAKLRRSPPPPCE